MREIKFRAQRVDGERDWVYGFYYEEYEQPNDICYTQGYIVDKEGDIWQVDPETVSEYTGLKDKNGKEIYEGDIFASGVIGSICQDRSDCPLYRVVFKEGSFLGQSIPYEEEYSIYIRPEDCEVIGSIHENPELLGE